MAHCGLQGLDGGHYGLKRLWGLPGLTKIVWASLGLTKNCWGSLGLKLVSEVQLTGAYQGLIGPGLFKNCRNSQGLTGAQTFFIAEMSTAKFLGFKRAGALKIVGAQTFSEVKLKSPAKIFRVSHAKLLLKKDH